jgi:hypothetical protein
MASVEIALKLEIPRAIRLHSPNPEAARYDHLASNKPHSTGFTWIMILYCKSMMTLLVRVIWALGVRTIQMLNPLSDSVLKQKVA